MEARLPFLPLNDVMNAKSEEEYGKDDGHGQHCREERQTICGISSGNPLIINYDH